MAYHVVLRRNGAKVGHFGPFTTKKQAIAQGQVLADDSARDVVVSVEPQRKKATTKKKRTNTRKKKKHPATYILPSGKKINQGISAALGQEKVVRTKYGSLVVYGHYKQQTGQYDIQYLREGAYQPTFLVSVSPDKALSAIKKASKLLSEDETLGNTRRALKAAYPFRPKWRTNTRRSNPSRGTFKSKTYAYYTVGNGKLTSGHGSPTGTTTEKKKARAEAEKQASRPENVMTAIQAQKYVGRSLTSSAAWYNKPRRNPTRKNPSRIYKGHQIKGSAGKYTVEPYGYSFKTLAATKKWLDKHVKDAYPKPMKSNPASKSILKRIDLANKWIEFAKKHDIWGIDPYMNTSFNGVINYTHKITVSAQKNRATFKYTDGYPKLGKKESETYNLNNTDTYSDTGVSALRYAINSLIIKPIKRGAKDEGITIPASLR